MSFVMLMRILGKAVEVQVAQSCPTLCTVRGILQARLLEWAAFPFSRGSPNAGVEPRSPTLQADSLPSEPQRQQHHMLMKKRNFSDTFRYIIYQRIS